MNRWYVETSYTQGKEPMKIYAKTLEDVQSKFPEAISITPCDDKSHLQYIEDIISRSELICSKINEENNQITELYYYYGNGFTLCFKLYKWRDDDEYFDYCEYEIRNDSNLYIYIGWMVSDIKKAYDRYFYSVPHKDTGYTVTPKEVKKNKYKKWYNKDGEYGWVDADGYFYFADKISMPNKKNKEEYTYFTQYKDTAILVKYKLFTQGSPHGVIYTEWFANEQDFENFWNMMIVKCPAYCQSPWYEVLKRGYNKLPPDDRKIVLRMPYINVEAELKEKPYAEVAHMWERLCLPMKAFKHCNGLHIWLEKIVRAYKEYLEKE